MYFNLGSSLIYLILLIIFYFDSFILESCLIFFFMNHSSCGFWIQCHLLSKNTSKVSLAFSLIFCFAFPLFPFLVLLLFYSLIYVSEELNILVNTKYVSLMSGM